MPDAPARQRDPSAPVALDAGDGWGWVWLKTAPSLAAEAESLGFPFYKPGDRAPKAAFSLRDADGAPRALLEFCDPSRYDCAFASPYDRKIIGFWREPDARIERLYWQAVPVLALRLLVTGDPSAPVPDGPSRFETGVHTGTVMSRAGLPHCDSGPALAYDAGYGRAWLKDGVLTRDDGPAIDGLNNRAAEYFVDGRPHRDDGPAYADWNERRWFLHGKPHRTNGPAIERDNGADQHYVDGVLLDHPCDDWKAAAALLLVAAHGAPVGVPHNEDRVADLADRFSEVGTIARNLDRSGTGIRWGESARSAINAMYLAKTRDAAARPAFDSLKAKCARLALMLTTDPALVPSSERASLLGLLDVAVANPPPHLGRLASNSLGSPLDIARRLRAALAASAPLPIDPPAGDGRVEFAFAWSRRSRSGKNAVQRHAGRGETTLDRVSVDDAPVFATLRRPDGGELAVRRIDGVPYRPVLAPDLWTPIREGAFRAAAREGAAWRDSPFRARTSSDCCAMALDEFCTPSPTKDEEAERAVEQETRGMAGRLAVIDGVIYRPTEEPELLVAVTQTSTGLGRGHIFGNPQPHDRRVELAWRLGDLDSTVAQATIVSSSQRHPLFEAGVHQLFDPDSNRRLPSRPSVEGLSFPLHAAERAHDAARRFASLVGLPFMAESPVTSLAEGPRDGPFDPTPQLLALDRAADNRSVCGGAVRDGKAAAEQGLAAFESSDPAAAEAALDLLDAYAATFHDVRPATHSAAPIGGGPLNPFDAHLVVLAEVASKALRAMAEASNDEDQDIEAFSTFRP